MIIYFINPYNQKITSHKVLGDKKYFELVILPNGFLGSFSRNAMLIDFGGFLVQAFKTEAEAQAHQKKLDKIKAMSKLLKLFIADYIGDANDEELKAISDIVHGVKTRLKEEAKKANG